MAKTLNQFLEGYLKVKNPDEQKFVDKHVVAKHADRNGNDDEVFKGSKVKMADRRKDRHGYNPGEDEKVYEAVETERVKHPVGQRPKGPGWVLKQAGEQTGKDHNVWERKFKKVNEELKGNQHKIDANKNGKVDAHDFHLLRKKKKVAEEVEELEEVSNEIADIRKTLNSRRNRIYTPNHPEKKDTARLRSKLQRLKKKQAAIKEALNVAEEVEIEEKLNMDKASMGTVIKDFQKSDAPQFKGKSQDKRRAMAIAAKLTAERGGKPLRKEEKLADLLDDLTETHRRTMLSVFDKLNEDNQKKFLEACETPEGVESMLDFAISHRGE